MSWRRGVLITFLALTVPPTQQIPLEEPVPRGESTLPSERALSWTKKSITVHALRVRLHSLGARTHSNWVLFRLPFSALERDRVRNVRFTPTVLSKSEVGALRIGSLCVSITATPLDQWTLYTASGIGHTDRYRVHPFPPTDDPTIVSINVPTRLANYIACGRDEGHLLDPNDWSLMIDWEER